jgi:uncharacterized membrane protein
MTAPTQTPEPKSTEVFTTKLLSTASIILGIGSIIFSAWVGYVIAFIWAFFAIITGIIALVQIKKYGIKGKGTATIGIVLGVLFILFILFKFLLLFVIFNRIDQINGINPPSF